VHTGTFGKTHVNCFELVLTFSKLRLPRKQVYQFEEPHLSTAKCTGGKIFIIILRTLKHIELSHSYLIQVHLSLRLLFKITHNNTHVTWYSRKNTKHIEGQVKFLHHSVNCKYRRNWDVIYPIMVYNITLETHKLVYFV